MRKSGSAHLFVPLAGLLLLAGCGDFWQNPNGTSTGTTTSSVTLTTNPATTVAANVSVTLTATVTPTAATGTVTFYNGSSSITTGTLSSGIATGTATFTSAGTASLTATYGGNSTYATSTSSAVSLTVTAATSGSKKPVAATNVHTSGIHATGVFTSNGGSYTASDSEAVIAEAGSSVTLTNTELSGAAGDGNGVLLRAASPSTAKTSFAMSGGSLTYRCDATTTPSCAEGDAAKGQSNPATLFSVANTAAVISLAGAKVTNNTSTPTDGNGTLLTVESSPGANAASAAVEVKATSLTGDAILDDRSSATLEFLQDDSGTGSSLTGAINSANRGEGVNLTLDKPSMWTVTVTSYLANLSGADLDGSTVNNIDGGGHCVYYSGTVNGSANVTFALSGGGYLAPAGTMGLNCE